MKNSVELHNALLTAEDFGRGKISYTTRGLRVFVPSSAKASVPEAMRVASLADVDWSPVDRLWVPEPFADAFCETDIPATVAIIRGLPLHLAAFLPLSISALGHVCVPTRVTENLFLGCVESSKDERLLSSLSISAIVDASLQSTTGRRFEGIEYLTLDIADRCVAVGGCRSDDCLCGGCHGQKRQSLDSLPGGNISKCLTLPFFPHA